MVHADDVSLVDGNVNGLKKHGEGVIIAKRMIRL